MSIAYSDKPPSARFLAHIRRQRTQEARQQALWEQQHLVAQKREQKEIEALRKEANHRELVLCRQRAKAQKTAETQAKFVFEQLQADARKKRDAQRKKQLSRVAKALRSKIAAALRSQRAVKSSRTINLIGCSYTTFQKHIERQFKPGMSWENHALIWRVDYIRPCAYFNMVKPNEQRKCFNFNNLQPVFTD